MLEPILGQLQLFAFNFAPRGWAQCNGQLLDIASNTALFSILGTIYGGNGTTTFGLPDLRGRAPIHMGQGPGLSNYAIGAKGGLEQVVMSAAQMPSHSHALKSVSTGTTSKPTDGFLDGKSSIYVSGTPDETLNAASLANAGNNQGHENRPPYLAMNWCIAITGQFPSRT